MATMSPPLFSTKTLFSSPIIRYKLQGVSHYGQVQNCNFTVKPSGILGNTRPNMSCAVYMAAGGGPGKTKLDNLMNRAGELWSIAPQPVKSFPWERTLENFVQLIVDLTLAVVKYLFVPLVAVSSLSEMSYCAHEKKLFLVPFPLLIGTFFAAVLTDTALQLSPLLKDAEIPWHLISIAIFFILFKLPGPYYPYWGRILIPHFTNGGLLMTLRFAWLWYKRPRKAQEVVSQQKPVNAAHSESS